MPAVSEYRWSDRTLAEASAELAASLSLALLEERRRDVQFLDTFDWRVHRAGFRLVQSGDTVELTGPDGTVVVRTTGDVRGRLAPDLPPRLATPLAGVIGLRALLPVAPLTLTERVLAARNDDDKIVARVVVSALTPDGAVGKGGSGRKKRPAVRLAVLPLRGYPKEARRLAAALERTPGVQPAGSLFEAAVRSAGRRVGDYSAKLNLDLRRDMPALDAVREIHRNLAATIRANEDGVLADFDSEFLHDYRVAVRRVRSALKELPGVLPPATEARLREEFRWLGDVTTPTRDLDVYLLAFPEFAATVGSAGADLEPLRKLLSAEQRRAHAGLVRALSSKRYGRLLAEWEQVTEASTPVSAAGPAAATPIGDLADARIRRVARRVLHGGAAITAASPAEALHDLRKRCKELRYLLEFFAPIYDGAVHGPIVSALKGLQDNLGTFQDTQVQSEAIGGFAERLMAEGTAPAATLLAIGRLVGALAEQQQQARTAFTDRFAIFSAPENQANLESLTGGSA